jgi:uncharacterized damage-inducible protein DinB
MAAVSDEQLRFPIGKFHRPASLPLSAVDRAAFIETIAQTPGHLAALVRSLSDEQLERRYRPGGWTIRQVVHHVPDSHMNAYVRMKMAATEDAPPIRTYREELWAELPEARTMPVAVSLQLLDALHQRWVMFLRNLAPEDFSRPYIHPDLGAVALDTGIALYAWHGRHHTAHVEQALARP